MHAPHLSDRRSLSRIALIQGSARALPVATHRVDCIVTSPPFYGLRRYEGLVPERWPGGDYVPMPGVAPVHCGAWQGLFGEESTVEAYIWHLLLCLDEAWRVLAPTGVAWVNLGDAYSSGNRQGNGTRVGYKQATNGGMNGHADPARPPQAPWCPEGSLLGIPARFLLAAQARGWTIRQDVIWHKVAPMPEPVRGWDLQEGRLRRGSWRFTRAHEYVFMLTKGMHYFANSAAVREEGGTGWHGSSFSSAYDVATMPHLGGQPRQERPGRNPRSVRAPAPSPYRGAHYATFPQDLIAPLIAATCPARQCTRCRAPYVPGPDGPALFPTCGCPAAWRPGLVLDMFAGVGTTPLVARALGRDAIGVEASATYLALARARLGLADLARWEGHSGPQTADPCTDLPLFAACGDAQATQRFSEEENL